MSRAKSGISYNRASAGSGRGISASQWNGFLGMHQDFYAGNASNQPTPPILANSVIASAVLKADSEAIGPFQPVRLVKQINFTNPTLDKPSYVVEPVDAVDANGDPTDRHGNYGFTLGEGCTADNGGRIVIAGTALVALDVEQLYYDVNGVARLCSYDSSFYIVPDETLSADTRLIGPVGHFRVLSWYDPTTVSEFEDTDTVYVAVDMSQRATSFKATTAADVDAATEASGVFTMESVSATPMFASDQTGVAATEYDVSSDVDAYDIQVYNSTGAAVATGEHLISYSLEYNRFIISVAGSQIVKIGKADADITADSTGTVSIWRAGVDTTENVEDVELDWMHGGTKVSAGKEVMITFFADEGIWRITGAECEDA